MSHSTAFCYVMYIVKQNEREIHPRANFFNWRDCCLWKNINYNNFQYFGLGRYGPHR